MVLKDNVVLSVVHFLFLKLKSEDLLQISETPLVQWWQANVSQSDCSRLQIGSNETDLHYM